MVGADAASSLADSAGLFAPEWISELEALQQAADAAFVDIAVSAASSAAGIAGSATTVSDAWTFVPARSTSVPTSLPVACENDDSHARKNPSLAMAVHSALAGPVT